MPLAVLHEVPGTDEETENVDCSPSYSYNLLRLPVTFFSVREGTPILGIPNVTRLHNKPNYVVGHSEFVTKLVMCSEGSSYIAL
jgi:hypothetical protein